MSEKMEQLRDLLCEELDKVAEKKELTRDSLDIVNKLTHSIKNIDTIMAMEESGYSEDYYEDGSSYARGRGRNAKRDSRGRYSRDNSYEGSRSSYARRGYSRGYSQDKEDMISQLEDMMNSASDDSQREAIRKALEQMEK